ncbi:helix-turn-helix domain-containing protein [Thermophilibacter provencensis]|uniref:helix-turn-helix domain-containing protein n=1 Tax=Thermophilibacter provencensis TaxID=1852386 RepID=UPI002352FCA2|nr:helix-turn-helix transcriptional regulator [Thermophilibacter provencensis]
MILGFGPTEMVMVLVFCLFQALPWILFTVVCVLAIRWFVRQDRPRKDPESVAVRRSLAEVLRAHRERCKMTQEFVAEKIGVSRQAVSKWESGASEPSTTNLVKVARL